MYRFLSDSINLKAVFGRYSTIEALKVKGNIDLVVQQLKIPSKTLLEHMEQEGINLTEISQPDTATVDYVALSETVIKSHLRATFLCPVKLYAALAALTLSQQVELRDLLMVVSSYLRLPSETLLRRMEEEGLTLDKLGVAPAANKNIDTVRNTLNALNAELSDSVTMAVTDNADTLASLKQRIQQLKSQSSIEHEKQVPQNVVNLTGMTEKLKLKM